MALNLRDNFNVIASANLGTDDFQSLSLLYLPILGGTSFSLYMILYGLISKETLMVDGLSHQILADLLNLNASDLEQARSKLEAVGLLNSYKGEGYVYFLKCPLFARDFFKNTILSEQLNSILGELLYKKLLKKFTLEVIEKDDLTNITKSFNDVFKPTTVGVGVNAKGYLISRNTENPIKIGNANFDLEKFLICIKPYYDLNNIDADFKKLVKELSYTYSLNEMDLSLVFRDTFQGKPIDNNRFKENVRKFFIHKTDSEPKFEEKESESNGVHALDRITPSQVFSYFGKNRKPSTSDLKVITKLEQNIELPVGVINALIFYVITLNDGRFPGYNYIEKIAAEWARKDIVTTEKAISYINEYKKDYAKPVTNRVTSKPTKVIEAPEWVTKFANQVEEGEDNE